jgi:hypothetical protein
VAIIKVRLAMRATDSVDDVRAKALILLCQDRSRRYVVMCGTGGDLGSLLAWGAKNWFLLPQDEVYYQAVRDTIETRVRPEDDHWRVIVSPAEILDNPSSTGTAARGMDFDVEFDDRRTVRLSDVTDALLFVVDESGELKHANGGSGMQKGSLLETGVEALFGTEAAEEFRAAKFSGMPSGVREMYDQMRRKMRTQPDEPLVVVSPSGDRPTDKKDLN